MKSLELPERDAAFAAFSAELIECVRFFDVPADGLFIAFCPKTSVEQAQWIQRGERIQNPYENGTKLDCGEIQGPLAP